MLTALVLICSVVATPDLADCSEKNARVVMVVPEQFQSPITCAMHGQAYVAETAIGRDLAETDRVKVVCTHREPQEPPVADAPSRTLSDARVSGADGVITDVNIVTALDISDSVDPEWMRIEIEGTARAILAPEVIRAIQRGRHGRVGFAVFAWYHDGIYPELVSWTLIVSEKDAMRVSNEIADCLRMADDAEGRKRSNMHHLGRLTDLSAAIDHAGKLLLMAPYATERAVVNIIGNGVDNLGEDPQRARDSVIGQGGTINGVVLGGDLSVLDYYRQQVIGGPGAFLLSAHNIDMIIDLLARKFHYDIVMQSAVAPR
jgi:Protein of unknown function (DUF1194)